MNLRETILEELADTPTTDERLYRRIHDEFDPEKHAIFLETLEKLVAEGLIWHNEVTDNYQIRERGVE